MTKRRRNKRKNLDRSDSSMDNAQENKVGKLSDTPEVVDEEVVEEEEAPSFEVSQAINKANSVLYDMDKEEKSPIPLKNSFSPLSLDVETPTHSGYPTQQTESTPIVIDKDSQMDNRKESEIKVIMESLIRIEKKMNNVEKRLDTLEMLEKRVANFEKEISKVWNFMIDQSKKDDSRIRELQDKVESTDFSVGVTNDKVLQLEKEKDRLKDEVIYLQSQSMRNNLLFANIPEARSDVPENQPETERKLRDFLESKMKKAKDVVNSIVFERVHRVGRKRDNKSRNIVAKFALYKEREMVRKQGKELEGTNYSVFEQFPIEIVEKRKRLIPKMKEAKRKGHKAWVSYDTLYIDGKSVKDESD